MGLTNIGFGEIDDTDEVLVPNVIGVASATAQSTITSINLAWSSTTENTSDSNLGGKVKSQTPAPGTPAEYYTQVSAVVYNYVAPYSFVPVYGFAPVFYFAPVYTFTPPATVYGFAPYSFAPRFR